MTDLRRTEPDPRVTPTRDAGRAAQAQLAALILEEYLGTRAPAWVTYVDKAGNLTSWRKAPWRLL